MADCKLEEFITAQVSSVMEFASVWRECSSTNAERYPMSLESKWNWLQHYYAFEARRVNEAIKKAA